MRTIMIFLLGLISNSIFTQINLVPNGSFEIISSCPSVFFSTAQIQKATPWWNSNNSDSLFTTDLFNSCVGDSETVPINHLGYQQALTGSGYAGFSAWTGVFQYDFGEYLEVKLLDKIYADKQYRLCINLSLADNYCSYNLSKIRFALTVDSLISLNQIFPNEYVNYFPQLDTNNIYEIGGCGDISKENWKEICLEFYSKNNANYLTIGQFINSGLNMDTILVNPDEPWNISTYYYIDDVSLICITPTGCDDVGVEDVEELKTLIYPNPFKDQLTVLLTKELDALISLYDITGRLIQSIQVNKQHQITIPTTSLKQGVYLIEVRQDSNPVYRQKLVKS